MHAEPGKSSGRESEWDEIVRTIEFLAAYPQFTPISPVGKTTIDFLGCVEQFVAEN
jgi:hypothetical protein